LIYEDDQIDTNAAGPEHVPELDVTFYGMKEFRINDPDGNRLWIGQMTPAGA
jgi:uncharacterized glyoxalase superfamily protein PhnB